MKLFVLDAQSADDTVAIAQAAGARVEVRPFEGFVNARRYALAQVRTPWTFMVDADEVPDATLCAAMLAAPADADAYEIFRTTFYCGKPLRMWSNERLLRLFRTQGARVEAVPAAGGEAQLHERWACDGRVETLSGTLEHYSYPDAASYRRKYAEYTSTEARGLQSNLWAALVETLAAPVRFAHALLVRGAMLDGRAGWTVAWYSALYPAVVRWKALR